MNNLINISFSILIFLATTFFPASGFLLSAQEENNSVTSNSLQEMMISAIEEAKREGKTSVNIFLDETPDTVSPGDLATVYYFLASENGEKISTNISSHTDILGKYEGKGPIEIYAGQQDLIPGIHEAVIGMKAGEKKLVSISHEDAYGPWRNENLITMSSVRNLPKEIHMPLEEYKSRNNSDPIIDDQVWLNPYFTYRIAEVTEKEAILIAGITGSTVSEDVFGETTITPEGDKITIKLNPKIGAVFNTGNQKGKIVSSDDNSFTVDFNHPLACKNLELDLTVASVVEASVLKDWEIPWHDDYDEGLDAAEKTGKPVLLVLHSSQCQWCNKLLSETLTDPRMTMFRDDFVWIRVDSDKFPDLGDYYDIGSYPTILFLDSGGEALEKITGFRYAPVLRDEVKKFLFTHRNIGLAPEI